MNSNNISEDHQINVQIEDTISCLKWFPNKDSMLLASCGWDSKIRLFNVACSSSNNQTMFNSALAMTGSLEAPILSIAWISEGTPTVVAGSTDGSVCIYDVTQNKHSQIGKHDNGVKEVVFVANNLNLVISGGWDNKINFWDMRSPTPVANFDLGRKVYSMSLSQQLLIVALQDRVNTYFNLSKIMGNGFGPEIKFESHLKHQTRVVSAFPEGNGYAIGSIEGRVAIKYIDYTQKSFNDEIKPMNQSDDFAFRCHRTGTSNNEVYPVNTIAFNPMYGTFCTGGGDGTWMIWDKESRTRLKQGGFQCKAPITALDYSFNGDVLAYAGGYDWSKGASYENSSQNKISLHYLPDSEKKKKNKK